MKLLYALCLLGLLAIASAQTQRYEFKHSFRSPFYLGRGGTLPFWEFGGSAIVSEDRIRLTPALQSRVGWVWNSVPADMESWEVQVEYELSGGGSRGADGMALWYVAEPKQEGIAMGGKEEFQGMAIFLDTFDNDGQGDNPRISLWVNDGTMRFEPFDDGKHGEKGSCRSISRDVRSKIRVTYRDSMIQVETDGGTGWQACTSYSTTLPRGYFFGLSAATGHLTDNHDVFSFITYNLDPWRRRAPLTPPKPTQEPEPVQQQEQHQEQQQHEPEPVKPNPYLKKDAPNPYLPQQETQPPHEEQYQPPPPPKQEYHPPPPPPQEPKHYEQQRGEQPADNEQVERLFAKLDAMRNQQDIMSHTLTRLTDKMNALEQRNPPADYTDDIHSITQRVRDLHNTLNDLRKYVEENNAQFSRSVNDLKTHVSSEQGNTYNNVARLTRELQQQIGALQTVVERGDRDQNSALAELRNSKEELKTVVESSGSVSWWVYFAFFQLCFGVGFAMWKKARDDANKKFL